MYIFWKYLYTLPSKSLETPYKSVVLDDISHFQAVALRGGGGGGLGAWAPDVLPKAPDLFEDGPFTSQINMFY